MSDSIHIKGARQHNLKNLEIEIPRNSLTVITGVSGSGKSSLVFDTLYAEGQRRYVESLSTYAKQFLERMDKPEVDSIEGINPAIAIEQKNPVKTSRSTVGTATEIYDYLRLLWARIGRTICSRCGKQVRADTVQGVVDKALQLKAGTRCLVLFPLKLDPVLSMEDLAEHLISQGFIRVMVGGEVLPLDPVPSIDPSTLGQFFVVVDRLIIGPGIEKRLADSIQTAFTQGDGQAYISAFGGRLRGYSERFTCLDCQIEYKKPTPQLFSFNNPYGACPECRGFGNKLHFDLDLIIPDKSKTLAEGAIEPWFKSKWWYYFEDELQALSRKHGVPLDVPFEKLRKRDRDMVLYGTDDFEGVFDFFDYLERKRYKKFARFLARRYMGLKDCPGCRGTKLRPEALNVKIAAKTIAEINRMTVSQARRWFAGLRLSEYEETIASQLLREIRNRLDYLVDIGLDYVTLDRLTRTLSGGEAQRINLANSLGAHLVGTLYILDEPTIGLHPRDTDRMVRILKMLRDMGNTIVVVEHDREVIASGDHIIDLGPGAGERGGRLVYAGPYENLLNGTDSLTGRYLRGEETIPVPKRRRPVSSRKLIVRRAREHNLKEIDVEIPLGVMVCVTGVSGSGKSTLVHDILFNGLSRSFGTATAHVGGHDGIAGLNGIEGVVLVDQSPIGRTPRSNPVTYIKAFDPIRQIFAQTQEARLRGYKPGRFSFNLPQGRCEACQGDGAVRVEMHFMADVFVTCDQCGGKRYNRETLEVRYRGKNISDVLDMTVNEAISFFSQWPKIGQKLWVLQSVGLGYIKLGQPATTLSGGEAQRVKIARELAKKQAKNTLYILDEPTTGLHFDDIKKLLAVLNKLTDRGNTVLLIEHNLDVIKTADWVIDLGPEGGQKGGHIVATGTPEKICKVKRSYTGKFLRKVLSV
ncbi:MAG: excinuclease ABC subunit UvrA [bacterium]